MRRWSINIVLFVTALAPASARAQGFATTDLTLLEQPAAVALGRRFETRAEPDRLTLTCEKCVGEPLVDLILGKQADGTEERVRSGATTIADIETFCRRNSDACRVTALDVGAAVGWISSYPAGERRGATAIIILGEQMLTVRALARGDGTARSTIDRLLPLIRAKLIGR
jgi:hypothetical protein